LSKYFELVFLQLQLVQILYKLIIIWVNYKKTKRGPFYEKLCTCIQLHHNFGLAPNVEKFNPQLIFHNSNTSPQCPPMAKPVAPCRSPWYLLLSGHDLLDLLRLILISPSCLQEKYVSCIRSADSILCECVCMRMYLKCERARARSEPIRKLMTVVNLALVLHAMHAFCWIIQRRTRSAIRRSALLPIR